MPASAEDSQPAPAVEDAGKALLGGNPADEMPEVELQAVTAANEKQKTEKTAEKQQEPTAPAAPTAPPAAETQPTSKAAPVDSQGRTFDPLLHECTDDGEPVYRADGVTLKCRRVPLKEFKTKSKVNLGQPAQEPAAGKPEAPKVEPVDPEKEKRMREAGAKTMAAVQLLVMRKGLGEHIGQTDSDTAALVQCWAEIFDHYGVGKVHPVVGLCVVSGMLVFDGMREAETRNALSRAWLWCKVKVGSLWLRMRGRDQGDK